MGADGDPFPLSLSGPRARPALFFPHFYSSVPYHSNDQIVIRTDGRRNISKGCPLTSSFFPFLCLRCPRNPCPSFPMASMSEKLLISSLYGPLVSTPTFLSRGAWTPPPPPPPEPPNSNWLDILRDIFGVDCKEFCSGRTAAFLFSSRSPTPPQLPLVHKNWSHLPRAVLF